MNRPGSNRAFTLLELLVAAVITLMLAGLVLAVSTGALDLWRRTQGDSTAMAEAVAALDMMERDLQAALHQPDGRRWLAVSVANDVSALANRGWLTTGAVRHKPAAPDRLRLWPEPGATGQRRPADARFGLTGAWLRFFTLSAESAGEAGGMSLPRAVAYQIARRPVRGPVAAGNPAATRYQLYRSAVTVETTMTAGYSITATAYGSTGNNPAAQRAASTIMNPNSLDVLATNVIDCGVWLYARESDGGLRLLYPADPGDLVHEVVGGVLPPDAERMPTVADLVLRVLTEEGATRLAALEAGLVARPAGFANDAAWWWAVAEAHSRVLVRRVEVKGGGR
ncbi:MAG: type II secretion system protein [Opitutaceae bacterium]|nr:type II secretion system protein [Opitutaceae bacterium]